MSTNIYILGDSVAYGESEPGGGWVHTLNSFLIKRYTENGGKGKEVCIYNLSIASERTKEILPRMDGELLARGVVDHENIIVFAVGLNDSAFVHSRNGNWVDFNEFRENIKKIILIAQKFSKIIIFIGLTPADQEIVDPMPWDTDKSYRNDDIKKYDQALQGVAKKNGAQYIPIFDKFEANDYKKLLFDGAHPNTAGHQLIFETVKDYLLKEQII